MASTEQLQARETLAAAGRRRQQETARLGDAIAELTARIQAATYELLVMIGEFDKREGWGEGFKSCAHRLNWRTGLAIDVVSTAFAGRTRRATPDLVKRGTSLHYI